MTAVIAWISLVVAVLSVFYTARSFALSQRPYVGIIEHSYQLLGEPATAAMTWRFVLKNVGAAPTWVTVDENRAVVTTDGRATALPLLGEPGGGIYLMPGQTADLTGQFSDAGGSARVADVMSGRTTLDVHIRLTYTASGAFWWVNRYSFWSDNRLRLNPVPARFIMLAGGGN